MKRNCGTQLREITGTGVFLLAVFFITLFYGATLREGHNWGGDFSQYIQHAVNIAEGRSYDDLKVIHNSLNYVAPKIYSPVTPLMLAPVYHYFGLDLTAMKLAQLVFFSLSLLLIAKLFGRSLSTAGVFAVLVLFALNPYVWGQKDNIHSESLFLFFSFLSLWLMELRYRSSREDIWRGFGVLLGLTMYLAYATREIGVVLPLTVITYELVTLRKVTGTALVATGVFLSFALLQENLLEPHQYYPDIEASLSTLAAELRMGEMTHSTIFKFDYAHIARQVLRYGESLREFWSVGYWPGLIVAIIVSMLALTGYVRRLWLHISVSEIYTAGYVAVILLFAGFQGLRYLMPVIPLYLYYAFIGLQYSSERLGRQVAVILLVVIIAGAGAGYLHDYRQQDFSVIADGISSPDAVAMLDYIRTQTSPDDLIVFRKPRVLALLTGRKSSIYPARYNPPVFLESLDVLGADYIVAGHFESDRTTLIPEIEHNPERFLPVFSQGNFTVYRYTPH